MDAIRRFLFNYSDNFHAALVLWPALSLLLTFPILAYLYHRDGRLRPVSFVASYLAVLYALGIACFTLYPLPSGDAGPGITYGVPPQLNPLGFLDDIAKDGLKAVFQLLFNVVFFVPFGLIAGRLLRMRLMPCALFALAVSALVETAQLTGLFGVYPYAYRCFDVDDIATNVLGAVLGWLLARALGVTVFPEKVERISVTRHPGFVRCCTAMWIDVLVMGLVAVPACLCLVFAGAAVRGMAGMLGPADGVLAGIGMPWDGLASWAQSSTAAWGLWPQNPLPWDGLPWDGLASWVGDALSLPKVNFATMLFGALAVVFVAVEAVIPWFCGGSTIGGAYVHMTCESRERSTGSRLVFYVARCLTLGLALVAFWLAFPLLGLFYAIARKMPYDYVP